MTACSSMHCFYEYFPKLLALFSPPLDARLGSLEGQATRADSLEGTGTSVGWLFTPSHPPLLAGKMKALLVKARWVQSLGAVPQAKITLLLCLLHVLFTLSRAGEDTLLPPR